MAKNTNTSNSNNHHHHHHHQSSTTRRATIHASARPSELISAEALQHVVLPLKKTHPQHEGQEREDKIGDRMTQLLNEHPDFRFDLARVLENALGATNDGEGFTLFPLLCRRNLIVLRNFYQRVGCAKPLILLLSIIGFCYENTPSRGRLLETLKRTLLLLIYLLIAGISSLILASHFALKVAGHAVCILLLQASMLLLDWQDVESHMPPKLKWFGRLLFCIGDWMDRHLFLRKRYAGREWNKKDFEFSNPLAAQSRHKQLWSLPPPCIQDAGRQLCLDHRYMAREAWSQETSKHVLAINFCYLMLREDHMRKRSHRSTLPRQEGRFVPKIVEQIPSAADSIGETSQKSYGEEEESGANKHHQIMAMSTKLGRRTEHVLGLTSSSPSGGIELVRDDQIRRDSSTLRLTSIASSGEERLYTSNSTMPPETPTHAQSPRSDASDASSVKSCSSAMVADMNWGEISARIGMRVLNSAQLQRVVASEEAAERLKNITDQFVVSPNNNIGSTQEPTLSFASPYEVQSLNEVAGLNKTGTKKAPQNMPKSPCRPVHSMWTSAAAAGGEASSSDEESTIASLDWKESKSPEVGDVPHAPPRIIRTKQFPTKRKLRVSASPVRDIDNLKQAPLPLQGANMQLVEPEEASRERAMSTFWEEESHEIIDPSHYKRGRSQSHSHADSYYTERKLHERSPLAPGVKVAAPFVPLQPGRKRLGYSNYQMATVASSQRIFVDTTTSGRVNSEANCLSVSCVVDKSFLRNGEFTQISFRVMDEWSSRYMPKHSKVPIGACVATTFGIGVCVGWRVEDDCHVIRSLWQRRGGGSAHAYLNRDAIHGVVEAAVGFEVQTKCGSGKVLGVVDAGRTYQNGRYIVALQDEGVYKNCEVTLDRADIHACYGAQFMPVIEHISEACTYQIMLDSYRALLRQQRFSDEDIKSADDHLWKFWSENIDILWKSFLNAVDEDSEFDEGVENFMGSIIEFLERVDNTPSTKRSTAETGDDEGDVTSGNSGRICGDEAKIERTRSEDTEDQDQDAGFWILNDMLGGIFPAPGKRNGKGTASDEASNHSDFDVKSVASTGPGSLSYNRAFAVIRTLMKTVSLARAASVGKPQFRLAMTICREFLMFARAVIKIQQKNVSRESLEVWRAGLEEIKSTFGPLKERLEKIGRGIAQRVERQGRRAKIRVLRFADSILVDELFLNALCQGEWKQCLMRIETSLVQANVIDEASCGHYRKTARFLYEHMLLLSSNDSDAAARNNEKLAKLARFVQLMAAPKRSFLKLIRNDEVLAILERILVRVFCREKEVTRTLTIHASNFKSLRHLRILKDLSVSGRMWIPLMDAADEEFSYIVSRMPENAKSLMCPLSSIFSLAVAQFHKISAGHSTKDWLDFLMEEDAARIIHDIDVKLILALSSFSRDVKDMMLVIPYYPSIDDDILNLMDEVELDKFLKEASEAIDDADKLAEFIREKAATAIERFLAYLPKLSIPVERRDLGEGWVLTVGQDGGGDLTLSDVKVKRENLVCQVLGGDALFLPIFGDDDGDKSVGASAADSTASATDLGGEDGRIEESILDHIREMILQAKRHGSWTVGIGGVSQPPSDPYVASALHNLPVTSVLSCAIDLWRALEIDDDELLEIAIRDVSYQIQLHKELEEKGPDLNDTADALNLSKSSASCLQSSLSGSASFEETPSRFNPRVDPTVLFLEMKNLTLHLDRFRFRIEKGERRTIFDPVFEGCGTVSIQNLSILVRIECARERIGKVGSASTAPVLLLRELEVEIENVRLSVQETGADWLLNKAVKGFSENITEVVESNLKEQIEEQTKLALEQLNSYFLVNQDILLNLLGISLDDLEEHIVWV